MDNEEIDALKAEKDRTITILQFTKLAEIDDIYYEKNYYAVPEKHMSCCVMPWRSCLWSR